MMQLKPLEWRTVANEFGNPPRTIHVAKPNLDSSIYSITVDVDGNHIPSVSSQVLMIPQRLPCVDRTLEGAKAVCQEHFAQTVMNTLFQVKPASKHHKLDTDTHVFFYEQEFYPLSNFSAFRVWYDGEEFMTSEHAYHYQRFIRDDLPEESENNKPKTKLHHAGARNAREAIMAARSAHDAFKIAQENKQFQRPDWDDVKILKMEMITFAKAMQHEYARRKLLETGDRRLVEDAWRDSFWGSGPDGQGRNELGGVHERNRARLFSLPVEDLGHVTHDLECSHYSEERLKYWLDSLTVLTHAAEIAKIKNAVATQ